MRRSSAHRGASTPVTLGDVHLPFPLSRLASLDPVSSLCEWRVATGSSRGSVVAREPLASGGMAMTRRVVTRYTNGLVNAYQISTDPVAESAEPVAGFPVAGAGEVHRHAVAPDLRCAVVTMIDAAVCIGRDGRIRWQVGFGPGSTDSAPGQAASSRWMGRRSGSMCPTRWRGGATSRIGGSPPTPTSAPSSRRSSWTRAGHGGQHHPHPDGVHMLLDVGEGQDGVRVYGTRLAQGAIVLTATSNRSATARGSAPVVMAGPYATSDRTTGSTERS